MAEGVLEKPNGKLFQVKEQMINDLTTGLMLVFRVTPSGEPRLHVQGNALPFGNRDFQFNQKGELVGTGTGMSGSGVCEPSEGDGDEP